MKILISQNKIVYSISACGEVTPTNENLDMSLYYEVVAQIDNTSVAYVVPKGDVTPHYIISNNPDLSGYYPEFNIQ